MNIIEIIKEEIQKLVERQEGIYTIPELAEITERMGYDKRGQEVITKLLLQAYKENGDQGVINLYTQITGVEIEAISRGRYMFAKLVDPNR